MLVQFPKWKLIGELCMYDVRQSLSFYLFACDCNVYLYFIILASLEVILTHCCYPGEAQIMRRSHQLQIHPSIWLFYHLGYRLSWGGSTMYLIISLSLVLSSFSSQSMPTTRASPLIGSNKDTATPASPETLLVRRIFTTACYLHSQAQPSTCQGCYYNVEKTFLVVQYAMQTVANMRGPGGIRQKNLQN